VGNGKSNTINRPDNANKPPLLSSTTHTHTHTQTNTHTHTQIHTGTNTHTHTHITINRLDNANKHPNPINRLSGRLIATDRALSYGTHANESRHGTHVNEVPSHGTHWHVHQSRPEGDWLWHCLGNWLWQTQNAKIQTPKPSLISSATLSLSFSHTHTHTHLCIYRVARTSRRVPVLFPLTLSPRCESPKVYVSHLRIEFLLKTDGNYPKDTFSARLLDLNLIVLKASWKREGCWIPPTNCISGRLRDYYCRGVWVHGVCLSEHSQLIKVKHTRICLFNSW